MPPTRTISIKAEQQRDADWEWLWNKLLAPDVCDDTEPVVIVTAPKLHIVKSEEANRDNA